MRTLTTLSLAMLVLFAACKRAENKTAQTEQQTQTSTETMQSSTPQSDKLEKWPADYPVTGDSVAVIAVTHGGSSLGEIVLEFLPGKAPNHVRNFKWLASHGFYNGTKFHRVIKGFMIQGGDPQGTGMGGPGWNVDAEFNDTDHAPGVLSMARSQNPNSAGSQFFICHGSASNLNNQYTAFGKVIRGLDVVNRVAELPVGGPQGSTPVQDVIMTSVKIVPRSAAMPK